MIGRMRLTSLSMHVSVVTLTMAALTACAPTGHTTTPTAGGTTGSACQGGADSSTTRTVDISGRQRVFIEHLPAGFAAGRKYPAVIAFPGRGESDAQLQNYSGLDAVDAVVLYAQGVNGKDNKPTWEATPYIGSEAHDYEFTTGMIQWLTRSSCVDASRIGLTGKSDGAGFAASAACSRDDVAAVATISGAFYQNYNRCRSDGRPVPMLDMHGTSDPVMPYAGIPARGVYSIDAWLQLWTTRNHCTGPGSDKGIASDVVRTTWASCADGADVVNYRIIGGGHTWPGATAPSGPGGTTRSVNAAQAIADFLVAHPLSNG
jgi:polyhydroxybutyrate depolymerase